MAPPSTRRPGFSRRAQYGLFLGYVVAVGGILFALLLLVVATVDPTGFRALKGAALDATRPVSAAGHGVSAFFTGIFDSIGDYLGAGAQNEALKRRLAAERRALVQAKATELDNRRLKAMLKLTQEVPDPVAVTTIVGSSFDSVRRLATLSSGASSGIEPGQPVRAPEGLIGRVIERGRWASRVLLVSDAASNVPVRLVRDGTPAIATGHGDGTIDLKTLEVGRNPFRRGDVLVTSGIGGVYPPNIPVAVVAAIDGDRTVAKPLADPSRVDYAMVLRVYQPVAGEPLSPRTTQALQGADQ
ncbi:MAG: rod shape-determining protein MreC [Sphingomonadales bacterium]|jgi:rod shape-determining protein MreC|nr:rod shape-determining protein MreC [Sphingomonadales bacterium]MEA3037005.1 rod shape-determining protein MreC [Sphingomonadales bacterium]